jgi:thiamine monophosphate synthase
LQDIVANVTIPIVAIGGVNTENANHLAGSGIDGFAVITAISVRLTYLNKLADLNLPLPC